MHKLPPSPKAALIVPEDAFEHVEEPVLVRDEGRRLIHFIVIALAAGILGIVLIAVLQLQAR